MIGNSFYSSEALSWLGKSKNDHALNGFRNTESAIEAVKRLYESGATKVDVEVMVTEKKEGRTEFADTLEVTFRKAEWKRIAEVIVSLGPDNLEGFDLGPEPTEPNPKWVLWWD